MIRRAVKEKSLYRINSLIDINNIVSIRYRLPIGVYDMDRIDGDVVTLDIGRSGEEFTGLTGRTYNVENKPVLRDGEGIFGSPIVDSERTKITDNTRNAAAVIFSHIDEPLGHCINAAEEYAGLARKVYTGVTTSSPVKAE
jgi:DNA/RNA-binding domain of Phe-tRNA-synthetase-like protein